ncbi:dihydroxyacetone kinase Dak1 [Drepanopeziza brunnea f. sp. 'multigermtubi' MB_m1]|uniref:Dihydroxyacetone kinase Dak1 n=1 Tax=Marssonina brunnea f. sp. multigermtubi (strain MB_m1) TaxID=1072389 RepID=K1WSK7_MARBU|nr:dihydroxyacetone kinase Dak1 [Drepanopeziza brunnea f. sp. 'multigermtubi' MB_m1]EKD15397.1 dihydroxyacetone kinase Dak1 [Drepanopeziza brunnea f. sp. 'multigermtubi' MB_m1]
MATGTYTGQTAKKETFHFINDAADAVNEAAIGLTEHNPNLSYATAHKIVYRSDLDTFRKDHVTTIGFAGGGHEPMFAGFVGPSFLSCAVSGNIFASPTAAQIFEAIRLCQAPRPPHRHTSSKGTLIVCGNYTGDILNAGLAITRATAAGYKVRFTPVGDDVAVGRKKGGKVGRRGLSGHVVGLKIACALADRGESLERVGDVMEYIAANSGTIAVAFDRCENPTTLPPATIELGLGCHGEPGLRQISPVPSPEALTREMITLLTDTSDADRAFIPFSNSEKKEEAILLVNSSGSTSDEVLARFAELAIAELDSQGITVKRMTLGPMVTSLKQSGFGFTVWRLPGLEEKCVLSRHEALAFWDREVQTASWRQ